MPRDCRDREEQLRRLRSYLRDFPDKRRNVRLSGLRDVGKTVLLKEYRDAVRLAAKAGRGVAFLYDEAP